MSIYQSMYIPSAASAAPSASERRARPLPVVLSRLAPSLASTLALIVTPLLLLLGLGAEARWAANMPQYPRDPATAPMHGTGKFMDRYRQGRPLSAFAQAQHYASTAGDDSSRSGNHFAFRPQASGAKAAVRIRFELGDLYNDTKHCTMVGQVVRNYDGESLTCVDEDILTADKRNALVDVILPGAQALLQGALMVDPIAGNLMLPPATAASAADYSMSAAFGPDPLVNGFPDTDFLLFISAFPAASVNTLAAAGSLAIDAATNRSIAGHAFFPPRHIFWGPTNDSLTTRDSIRTAAHEIMHAMGWTDEFFKYLAPAAGGLDPVLKTVLRGKNTTVLRSPTILAKARAFFNCSTLLGIEIEDEGGAGTAGSHLEGRNHYDDIMAGSNNTALSFLSHVVLAFFADLTCYEVNWAAAEVPAWMRGIGCGAETAQCNGTAAGAGTLFCFESPDTTARCGAYGLGRGLCSTTSEASALPSYWQYFADPNLGGSGSGIDRCPMVGVSDANLCTNTASNTNDTTTGQYFAPDSRCFTATANTAATGGGGPAGGAGVSRCLQTRCEGMPNGTALSVSFRIGSSTQWLRCSYDGEVVSLAAVGFDGSVTCPPLAMLCGFRLPHSPLWADSTPAMMTTTTTAATTTTTAGGATSTSSTPTAAATTTTSNVATTTSPAGTATSTTSAGGSTATTTETAGMTTAAGATTTTATATATGTTGTTTTTPTAAATTTAATSSNLVGGGAASSGSSAESTTTVAVVGGVVGGVLVLLVVGIVISVVKSKAAVTGAAAGASAAASGGNTAAVDIPMQQVPKPGQQAHPHVEQQQQQQQKPPQSHKEEFDDI